MGGDLQGNVIGRIFPQQVVWHLIIRENKTNQIVSSAELRGSRPSCPSETFFAQKGQSYVELGDPPSPSDVYERIRNVFQGGEIVYPKFSVRLYADPTDAYASIDVEKGQKLIIVIEQEEWYKVKTENNVIGWIRKTQISW